MDGNGAVDAADAILARPIMTGFRLPTSGLIFQDDVAISMMPSGEISPPNMGVSLSSYVS